MARRLLFICFLLWASPKIANASLTSVSPNSAQLAVGSLTTTISSTGDFVQTASPNGNVYSIELRNGSSVYTLADGWASFPSTIFTNGNVIDPNTFQLSNYTLPANIPTGIYSLYVGYLDPWLQGFQTYPAYYDSLPSSFTVLPPDGYIQGHIFLDLNENGQFDVGEPPFPGANVYIVETGTTSSPDANGDFSVAVANGSYTVRFSYNSSDRSYLTTSPSQFNVTVTNSNATGLQFGVKRKLKSVFPSQLVTGQQVRFTLIADSLFSLSQNSLYYVSLQRQNPTGTITTYSANITVLDTNTASVLVTVPANAVGVYNAIAYLTSGANSGQHRLIGCVNIVQPSALITGRIYFDSNGNGTYDSGETPLRYERVHLMPDDAFAYTDANGIYSIGALNGSYSLSWDALPGTTFLLSSADSTYSVTVPGTVSGFDFGLRTTNADYTCSTSITSVRPRCLTNNTYTLSYQNQSNSPFNGRVYLLRDPQTVFISSIPPISGSNALGDSIWWDLNGISPFSPSYIRVILGMPGPNAQLSNRMLLLAYDAVGALQNTIQSTLTETVLCSFDPNDKACTPEGIGPQHFTLLSDPLEYLIRFQNTGNDTAYDVRVYDRLDTSLNVTSMELIETSHSVRTNIDTAGLITFFFPNIYLPDSTIDEEHSHGFIRFRIRPKASTPDFTRVENTADIVFDLNPPVITNTTYNTLVQQIPLGSAPVKAVDDGMIIYPNPSHDKIRVNLPGNLAGSKKVELNDVTGRLVLEQYFDEEGIDLDLSHLESGVYTIRVVDDSGVILSTGQVIRN